MNGRTGAVVSSRPLVPRLPSPAGFRKFAFTNPARLWAFQNPKFFDGTSVEAAVRAELAL